jgi:hypothetical protein
LVIPLLASEIEDVSATLTKTSRIEDTESEPVVGSKTRPAAEVPDISSEPVADSVTDDE